jgi:hypothetical protein
VIRRNTNRRHMIGDHHARTAGRATMLVRAVDEILGTHRSERRLDVAEHGPDPGVGEDGVERGGEV